MRSSKISSLFLAMNESPIAYHRIYTKITGKLTSGVLLSQLVYWGSTRNFKEFYKTNEEISDETGLSIREVKSAKKILVQKKFIKVELKSLPRKSYYTILSDNIIDSITDFQENDSLVGTKRTNCKIQNEPTTSEITSKNTSENNINYINSSSVEKIQSPYSAFSFSIFKLFIEKHNSFFIEQHPYYKKELLTECLVTIDFIVSNYSLEKLEDWEQIIDIFLKEFHQKHTDCHFRLFITGGTIENYVNRLFL